MSSILRKKRRGTITFFSDDREYGITKVNYSDNDNISENDIAANLLSVLHQALSRIPKGKKFEISFEED